MKRKTIIIVLCGILALASVYFIFFGGGFNTLNGKDNDFAIKDTASITKIFMADKNNKTVTLTRKSPNQWLVNGRYEVRSDAINSLLYTMNSLAVKNLVDPKSWNTVVNNLASGSVKVEVYSGDKLIKLYYVGSETQDELGTYMLLANPKTRQNYGQPYIIYIPGFDGYLTTRYFIPENMWRDRTIFNLYPYQIKSLTVRYPHPETQPDSGFTIMVSGKNNFNLINPSTGSNEPFDPVAVKQYLTYYQFASWEILADNPKRDSILSSPPLAVISLQDTLGHTTTIKLFNKAALPAQVEKYGVDYKYDPDRLYALINDKDFVIVQYYVFGKMLQKRNYFQFQRLAPGQNTASMNPRTH
jgi:hypothetical protein